MNDAINPLLREIAEFIALYETIEEKLLRRANDIKVKIGASEELLKQQLERVQTTLADFQSIMTEEGAARWRITCRNTQQDAESYLRSLQTVCTDITDSLKNNSEQLKQTADNTLTQISEATNLLPITDFKQTIERGCHQIKTTFITSARKTTGLMSSMHRKNLVMVSVLTLFIVLIIGLYLNDEWPWEIHQQVVKERNAGQTLLSAWPLLTPDQQQAIINAAKKNPNLQH